jgi:hypothetical protein
MTSLQSSQNWFRKLFVLAPSILLMVVMSCLVIVHAQTTHGLNLTWTLSNSAGVAGQNVYRGTVNGGPYTKLTATPLAATVTSYLDPVTDGNTYFYVTTAISKGPIVIESAFSNQATAVAPGPPPNPQTGVAVSPQ